MTKTSTRLIVRESLLVELWTEELPPKSLQRLSTAFADGLCDYLRDADLADSGSIFEEFATPRRLGARVSNVRGRQPHKAIDRKGPSVRQGLDESGKPTQALVGFARSCGVEANHLERRKDDKGEYFVYSAIRKGESLSALLPSIISGALKRLPVAKVMRWGSTDVQFVRPVHGLVILHGSKPIKLPSRILGFDGGTRLTAGHRFLSKGVVAIPSAEGYENALEQKGRVIVNFGLRKESIRHEAQQRTHGSSILWSDALLDEVTALVELPKVYKGSFDPQFLEVPQECLILSMQRHQRYLPLSDREGRLMPKFLMVSNIQPSDPMAIVRGNERVLSARLSDAKFFYDQDRKQSLESRVPQLAKMAYYREKLGTQLDRVRRIQSLAKRIAKPLKVDESLVSRAAELSKADLLTDMVGEFPELQGVMGRYYALNDKERPEIANAIEQHYWPRFAGDRLPEDSVAYVLALADKLETIAGMFGVGQQPTGDKDPYALRRHGLGVIRILIEKKLEIGIQPLVDLAIGEMPQNAKTDWLPVVEFLLDRARSYFSERGFSVRAIESVLRPFGSLSSLHTLLEIVAEASRFVDSEEGRILAEANKRITNILKKSGYEVPFGLLPDQLMEKPNPNLFKDPAEIEFWKALTKVGGESLVLRGQKRFAESLRVLSQLGRPTKSFFESVLVNAEEPDIRANRITLLQHARAYMNQAAD